MKQINMIGLVLLIIISSNTYAADESINDVMKADQNKDGKVSFEEYKALHDAELKARFNSKDINQDGFVDTEEKEVAKVKLQEEQKAEKKAAKEEVRHGYEEDRKKRKRHFFKYQ
ncbi:MAG: hypothetical protein ACMZ63_04055 [Methylotenera sp.]